MPRNKLKPAEAALTEEQAREARIWFYGARTVKEYCAQIGCTPHTFYDAVFYRGPYARLRQCAEATGEELCSISAS